MLKYQQPTDANGRRLDELVFSVDAFDDNIGVVVPKKVTIRTSSKHGFPTPKEDELLIGLMQFTRMQNNFTKAKVEFRISELLRALGWADNGRSRRQLRNGLDRLAGVKLKFENSWQNDEGREYEREFVTGLLDGYDLNAVKEGSEPGSREVTTIQWSAEVFADIQRGNVKELNTNEYFSLDLPLSRRMYRFLDKHVVAGKTFEMNLQRFASHLGLSETSHIGKIRERLRKPMQELEGLGTLIRPASDAERYHQLGAGNWLIRFDRAGETRFREESPRQTPASKPTPRIKPRQSPEASQLVQRFYELWCENPQHKPSFPELKQARDVIEQHGTAAATNLVPIVVKLMKERFPNATSFGATKTYWHLANQQIQSRKVREYKQQASQTQQQHDEERRQQDVQRKKQLQSEWNRLEETQQESIRREVLQERNDFVRRKIERREFQDPLVVLACLNRLEKRSSPAQSS